MARRRQHYHGRDQWRKVNNLQETERGMCCGFSGGFARVGCLLRRKQDNFCGASVARHGLGTDLTQKRQIRWSIYHYNMSLVLSNDLTQNISNPHIIMGHFLIWYRLGQRGPNRMIYILLWSVFQGDSETFVRKVWPIWVSPTKAIQSCWMIVYDLWCCDRKLKSMILRLDLDFKI